MNLFTMIVGTEKHSDGRQINPVTAAEAFAILRDDTARAFGGYTLSHCEGGWTNDAGATIVEGAVRIDVYTDKSADVCRAFADHVRKLFGQQCVLMDYRPAVGAELVYGPQQAAA